MIKNGKFILNRKRYFYSAMQTTSHIFMVRPAAFGFNEETALTNAFQSRGVDLESANEKAQVEFDRSVNDLRNAGVHVQVFEDSTDPFKPDAIFPNNWISLHADGTLVLYPMCTPNRRAERRQDIVEHICEAYDVKSVLDFSGEENSGRYLEGTGSVVFDHTNKVAYACLSQRTDKGLFERLCKILGYEAVSFFAHDVQGKEIYHTNVMMCMAEKFSVICLDSISDKSERQLVVSKIISTNREVIDISFSQMEKFAGNMLGLKSKTGQDLIVLSSVAFNSLSMQQRNLIEKNSEPVLLQIPTIESVGGGSARCMIAEIFCSHKQL